MSILDGYNMCGETKERPFLTLRAHTVTFSKAGVNLLGNPEYVHTYVNLKEKKYAVQPCKKGDYAFQFYTEPKEGKQFLVRWANKERVSDLTQMLSIDSYPKGVRIYGDYYREENVIIFDLNDFTPV